MRATALIGTLALGLALGAIVVGHLLLVPMLAGDTALVDANLARALTEPLALRCAEVVLAACVLSAIVSKPGLRHRAAPTLTILAAGIAACDRLVLLPEVHQGWAKVDLVAMRPLDRIAEAEQVTMVHHAALATMIVLLLAAAVVTHWHPKD